MSSPICYIRIYKASPSTIIGIEAIVINDLNNIVNMHRIKNYWPMDANRFIYNIDNTYTNTHEGGFQRERDGGRYRRACAASTAFSLEYFLKKWESNLDVLKKFRADKILRPEYDTICTSDVVCQRRKINTKLVVPDFQSFIASLDKDVKLVILGGGTPKDIGVNCDICPVDSPFVGQYKEMGCLGVTDSNQATAREFDIESLYIEALYVRSQRLMLSQV